MQWTPGPYAGFTTGEPWLSVCPGHQERNVESQLDDPHSMLALYRELLSLRRANEDLRVGRYTTHPLSSAEVYAYWRGDTLVMINFSKRRVDIGLRTGNLELSTLVETTSSSEPGCDGLGPLEGVVLSGVSPAEVFG